MPREFCIFVDSVRSGLTSVGRGLRLIQIDIMWNPRPCGCLNQLSGPKETNRGKPTKAYDPFSSNAQESVCYRGEENVSQ